MQKNNDITNELNQTMTEALLQLKQLINQDTSKQYDLLSIVKVFLLGVLSTAVDLTEVHLPGSAPLLYADIEAAAKLGGLRAISKWSSDHGSAHYSVSNIAEDDKITAMNYLGQRLSKTLFKGLYELPIPLRNEEMLLRGIEALLANVLNKKFKDTHQILDSFCDHVRMILMDLASRQTEEEWAVH